MTNEKVPIFAYNYYYISFDINGDCYLAALMNSFIHVCMYGHYFLSSFGVKAWWKRYLTQMQLLQFVICWIQPIYAFYAGSSCGYKDWLKIGMILYQTSMFVLFMHFYKKVIPIRKRRVHNEEIYWSEKNYNEATTNSELGKLRMMDQDTQRCFGIYTKPIEISFFVSIAA